MGDRLEEAAHQRERRLALLAETVRICTCTWPLDVQRNITGHDPECPAHTYLLSGHGGG